MDKTCNSCLGLVPVSAVNYPTYVNLCTCAPIPSKPDPFTAVIDGIRTEREYQESKALRKGWNQEKSIPEWLLIMRAELEEAERAWLKEGNKFALCEILQAVSVGVACLEKHGVVTRDYL